eukprot:jgi/Psemu1/309163/fgenesh1_kg.479_\
MPSAIPSEITVQRTNAVVIGHHHTPIFCQSEIGVPVGSTGTRLGTRTVISFSYFRIFAIKITVCS